MKFKDPVCVNVLSPLSLRSPMDFLRAVRTYEEVFPNVLPEKWGWWEPLDRAFDAQNIEALVPAAGTCETVFWQRKKCPKAEGAFSVRWRSKSPMVKDTHSNIDLTLELADVEQDLLVHALETLSVRTEADIAILDVANARYEDFAFDSASAPFGERFMLVTHVLRHWLPDVFWGTVFGPPYVRLFGKDRLMSAPAAVVKELGEEMIYLQLTDKLADTIFNFDAVLASRLAVKAHLAVDAFFQSERAYDRAEKGPTGDLFATPEFQLRVDEKE
ncbi:hypothetical protein PQR67_21385 [Paraburkholderia fungorum]|uniref:hypothetical protein n=1 Tax=Paraburkholderia fungorum TaxID=134537 RepID=UPI0038BA4310